MIAAVFPGQGSQKPGMGRALFEAFEPAREVFGRVQEATGLDVAKICFELDEETLRQTQNAQIALYTCGVAAFRAFQSAAPGVAIAGTAGHSVGEYAAVAAAEVVTVEDGARLVKRRGELMSQSGSRRPGTMAAVLGLDRDALDEVCRSVSTAESVAVVANDNCPGQLVISGDREAVARAGEAATAVGAKRVLPLNVSGAFHSPLMEEASEAMGEALRTVEFRPGTFPVYANVTAAPAEGPTGWGHLLEEQLKRPVRWRETMLRLRKDGFSTFIEFGGGEVLSGLLRRIDGEAAGLAVQDPASLEAVREALTGVTV